MVTRREKARAVLDHPYRYVKSCRPRQKDEVHNVQTRDNSLDPGCQYFVDQLKVDRIGPDRRAGSALAVLVP